MLFFGKRRCTNCRQLANQVIENNNGKLEKEQEIVQKKVRKFHVQTRADLWLVGI